MNINDLPKGSYTPVAGSMNINSLPQGSYSPVQPSFLSQLGSMGKSALNAVAAPFIGLAAKPVQGLASLMGQPDPFSTQGGTGDQGSFAQQTGAAQPSKLGVEQTLGDAAQIGSYLVPGATLPKMALMGSLQGGGAAMSQGGSVGDVAGATALGAGAGFALGVPGAVASKITGSLPTRIAQRFAGNVDPEAANYFLKNYKGGSYDSLAKQNQSLIDHAGSQVQSILKSPEYLDNPGIGAQVISNALEKFPNSTYTTQTIIDTAKDLVPEQEKLITKILKGTATLWEKNAVRSALDKSVKSVYTSMNRPPEKKAIGAAFAGALREEVQSVANETVPFFEKMTKNFQFMPYLQKQSEKEMGSAGVTLHDMVAGGPGAILGTMLGGPGMGTALGVGVSVAGERALKSPSINIGAAKALQSLGRMLPSAKATQIPKALILQSLLGNHGQNTTNTQPTL